MSNLSALSSSHTKQHGIKNSLENIEKKSASAFSIAMHLTMISLIEKQKAGFSKKFLNVALT